MKLKRTTAPIIATAIILAVIGLLGCSPEANDQNIPEYQGKPVIKDAVKALADVGLEERRNRNDGSTPPNRGPYEIEETIILVLYFDTEKNKEKAKAKLEKYDLEGWGYGNESDPNDRFYKEPYLRNTFHIQDIYELAHIKGITRIESWGGGSIQHGTSKNTSSTLNNLDLHGIKTWQLAGITGHGVQVGIIDPGFTGFSDSITPQLRTPPTFLCFINNETTVDNTTEKDDPDPDPITYCEAGNDKHGTFAAQDLLNVAPDVQLYISNASNPHQLNVAANWMTAKRNDNEITEGITDHHLTPPDYEPLYTDTSNDHFEVKVISHSAGFEFDGKGDGTSKFNTTDRVSPLNTVDATVRNGAIWVDSASNSGVHTWYSNRPSFTGIDLDFSPGDTTTCNTINPDFNERFRYQLRWAGEWEAQNQDLDRYAIPKELTSSPPSRCPLGGQSSRWPQNAKPKSTSTPKHKAQARSRPSPQPN